MTQTILGDDALPQCIDFLLNRYASDTLYVLSDHHCWQALPQASRAALQMFHLNILPESPKAEMALAQRLSIEALHHHGIVSIGSGTLTDLAKYISYHNKIPHIAVGTAASMNGYVSANASLLEAGHKQSFAVKAPDFLFLDIQLLTAAHSRLTCAGVGDTLCRSTILADHALATLCHAPPFDLHLLQKVEYEEAALSNRDTINIKALANALLASGNAMKEAKSSAPASQSEHMLVHACELLYPEACAPYYHGELVAVATVICAELQDQLWHKSTLQLRPLLSYAEASSVLGETLTQSLYPSYVHKYQLLAERLPSLQWKAQRPTFPNRLNASQLVTKLQECGCPASPNEIGLTEAQIKAASAIARVTRDRITILDFC